MPEVEAAAERQQLRIDLIARPQCPARIEMEEAADARIAAGEKSGMCGIPVGIKDLFCTRGVPSQAASRILEGFRPEYESTVSAQLFEAGAVMLGKLNRVLYLPWRVMG